MAQIKEKQMDDVTTTTDRFVLVTAPGGGEALRFRPSVLPAWESEGESYPEEASVHITFPDGRHSEYRPEALRAALDEVEALRAKS